MVFDEVIKDVVNSFGSLWNSKQRGNSLELITPFATTSSKFISVFLTKQGGDYVVSDGGWINTGAYEAFPKPEIDCFNRVFEHYKASYSVQEVESNTGGVFFYKKTQSKVSLPSLVLDMANFVSAIVSLADVEYEGDRSTREAFRKSASEYLQEIVEGELSTNVFLDSREQVKVNAIIKRNGSRLILLNYITGSNYHHFRNSISKTNILFEMADETQEHVFIDNKIALVDDTAAGYIPERVSHWLGHLIHKSTKVDWSRRGDLVGLLN